MHSCAIVGYRDTKVKVKLRDRNVEMAECPEAIQVIMTQQTRQAVLSMLLWLRGYVWLQLEFWQAV